MLRPSSRAPVYRGMTNTQQAAKSETTNTKTTEDTERGCCGGPAPAGADACCVQDAAAKAAGENGCVCARASATLHHQAR